MSEPTRKAEADTRMGALLDAALEESAYTGAIILGGGIPRAYQPEKEPS